MTDIPRLIEHAFPLKQASLDCVHEKNVRHGHISTLHIWPARRPLAACRAALIATLLPDPGTPEKRQEAVREDRRQGGARRSRRRQMPNGKTVERDQGRDRGRHPALGTGDRERRRSRQWFREEIRKAYGGRAPKVLDPFAGGGAIPLEAMRLGCEATAIDINPVAWFILKCTLEYPQKLAGQKRPLPEFILRDDEFMEEFFKAQGYGKRELTAAMKALHDRREKTAEDQRGRRAGRTPFPERRGQRRLSGDLAWHVRAWGQWVLDRARRDLARFYPTYADFEPLNREGRAMSRSRCGWCRSGKTARRHRRAQCRVRADYLADERNPRWVAKPTVAYLWARTVTCKNCRATVPLLKTRWLCKKANSRVLLTMEPNADRTGVVFDVQRDVPVRGGNAAQRREHDKRIGAGTMTRAGAKCPCCPAIMTMEDIRVEGKSGGLGAVMTAVVCDGTSGKEYRLPTPHETAKADVTEEHVDATFGCVPFGPPDEPMPSADALGMRVQLYGFNRWRQIFAARQLATAGAFLVATRAAWSTITEHQHDTDWTEGLYAALSIGVDRLVDRQSTICRWDMGYTKLQGTFTRFALPMTWDYGEGNPLSTTTGNYLSNLEWVAEYAEHAMKASHCALPPTVVREDAVHLGQGMFDAIVTDPPYYDAIPYSDLMDFFYVWLRRTLHDTSRDIERAFADELTPKWNKERSEGELIDEASRHDGDATKSKKCYEDGMARVFLGCLRSLAPDGRLVIVFAHKHPQAWETLVSAIIRAGFVVDGSWPIQTEMGNRTRALTGAALASSVWLVCRKRLTTVRPGWDGDVLMEMRKNIRLQLREFWDAGIRGPDFVWAATGPALEAYSKYPIVKKADSPDALMTVSEFLTHVRRMVVDFVVGRVLSGDDEAEDQAAADRLDEPTAYYLLHRNDFGMDNAPAGTCILYAVSCGLSDKELVDTWDILARTSGGGSDDEEDEDGAAEVDGDDGTIDDEGSGSKLRLKTWAQRKGRTMGYEAPGGRLIPLIDRVHRLMHLWKAQDVHKVDEYLDDNALRRNELFGRFLQSLVELSPRASEERSILESLSSHVGAKGARREEAALPLTPVEDEA